MPNFYLPDLMMVAVALWPYTRRDSSYHIVIINLEDQSLEIFIPFTYGCNVTNDETRKDAVTHKYCPLLMFLFHLKSHNKPAASKITFQLPTLSHNICPSNASFASIPISNKNDLLFASIQQRFAKQCIVLYFFFQLYTFVWQFQLNYQVMCMRCFFDSLAEA